MKPTSTPIVRGLRIGFGGLVMCVSWFSGFSQAADAAVTRIHVSIHGDDAAPGSADAPVHSLHRAQELARDAVAGGASAVVVDIGAGTYELDRPLRLTDADSGGGRAAVTYRSADGVGRARILGSAPVTGWEAYRDGIWRAQLPEGVVCHTLYEGDRRIHKARFPNHEYSPDFPCARERYLVTEDGTPKHHDRPGDTPQGPGWLIYPADEPPPPLVDTKAKLLIYNGGTCDWVRSMYSVRSIDPATRKLVFEARTIFGGIGTGARFFLEDDLGFLDAPGEFYVDEAAHVLYCKPLGSGHPNQLGIRRPVVNRLIEVHGTGPRHCASNLRLEGLCLEQTDCLPFQPCWAYSGHTDGALIWLTNASGIVIRNCHLKNSGRHGIMVVGHNTDHLITGCRIEHMGLNGVSFVNRFLGPDGEGPTDNRCEKNRLHNTHISHVGEIHTYAECVTVFHASYNHIDHCVLENSVRYAITVRGNTGPQYGPPVTNAYPPSKGNRFHHIRVSHCGQDGGDMGALHCANLNNPGGGSVNTFEQITVADTRAVPSVKDIGPDGIFLDWPRMAMDQIFRNVHIVRSQGRQLRSHGIDNGASAQTHNVSWKQEFSPDLMDYASIGLTDEYPVEFGGRHAPPVPPPPPRNLAVDAPSHDTVVLTWEPPRHRFQDVPIYTVFRNGAPVAAVAGSSFTDTRLKERTTYHYAVAARDGDFCHLGARTDAREIRTPEDRVPPTIQGAWAAKDGHRVRVLFSKAMDPATLCQPANYVFTPTVVVDETRCISLHGVELTVRGLDPSRDYTLTVAGVLDNTASANALAAAATVPVAVAGLETYYPMRVTADGRLLDCGGGTGDALLSGEAAVVPGAGPLGGPALVLDGQGGCAEAPAGVNFGAGDFTIMLWIMREGGGHIVLSQGNGFGSVNEWSFGWPGSHLRNSASFRVNNQFHSTAAGAIPLNQWVHVAFVKRGTEGFSYVNGKPSAQAHDLSGAGHFVNDHPLRIGRRAHDPDPQYFKGRIAEIRLFHRALEDDEIRDLANSTYAAPGE